MTTPAVTVSADDALDDVIAKMEDHQIRRVPVVDNNGCCTGIIAQADVASMESPRKTAEFVREVSRNTGRPSA